MLFDAHSHTVFSSDSDMRAGDAIAAAKQKGIGLIFTEHFDYDYKESVHFKDMDFLFDAKDYWNSYESLRGDSLLLGVEVGMTPGSVDANRAFIRQVPFDQVIGSIHAIDKLDIYYPDYYQGKTKAETYMHYLEVMAEMVRANSYIDVLGHIDYISRYAPYENKELMYDEYQEAVDQVLLAVIHNDTVMEINTRRLGDRKAVKSLLPIYRRYKELGGQYVTLGSDAHSAENVGMNMTAGQEIAEASDLKVIHFRERKAEY